MTLRTIAGLWLAAGTGLTSCLCADDGTPLDLTQATFHKWVEVQESIAREKTEWATAKEFLGEEIRLLKEERAALEEKAARLDSELAQTEKDLAGITEKNGTLKAGATKVEAALAGYEDSLRKLHNSFPEVLQDTLQPLMSRLPAAGGQIKSGISERMQVIAGALSQVDKFNGALTVVPELRRNGEGKEVQVQTLYLGLAQAWFVGTDARFAGRGTPGENGWSWSPDADAREVKTAIDIQQKAGIAQYVELPVSVQ